MVIPTSRSSQPAHADQAPHIVIAQPPERAARRKVATAAMPKAVIAEARDPRRIRRKPALATRIVTDATAESEDEHYQRGDAADRLWVGNRTPRCY